MASLDGRLSKLEERLQIARSKSGKLTFRQWAEKEKLFSVESMKLPPWVQSFREFAKYLSGERR